jgi:hypothetical protein
VSPPYGIVKEVLTFVKNIHANVPSSRHTVAVPYGLLESPHATTAQPNSCASKTTPKHHTKRSKSPKRSMMRARTFIAVRR